MKISEIEVSKAKEISMLDYLSSCGYEPTTMGSKTFFKSPFSYDNTPSLCVYRNTNTFYDWANGFGGDIIKLVMSIEEVSFVEAVEILLSGEIRMFEPTVQEEIADREFDLPKFLKYTDEEAFEIRSYAFKRGIRRNFTPSVFIIKDAGNFIRRPSVGYIHRDENMETCGIKMRDINPYKDRRFSARGSQKFYITTNNFFDTEGPLYIVESESSANSLHEYLCIIKQPCTIVSFGSWSNVPKELPPTLNCIDKRKVIIDYDGNEELYSERIAKFGHLDAKEVKLELPKGEDINSLFVSGKIHKYKNLFI